MESIAITPRMKKHGNKNRQGGAFAQVLIWPEFAYLTRLQASKQRCTTE